MPAASAAGIRVSVNSYSATAPFVRFAIASTWQPFAALPPATTASRSTLIETMNSRTTKAHFFALIFAALVCGCGTGLYPVEGRVVWKDGKPATELMNGRVVFDLPEKKTSALGIIQEDGSFILTTD